MAMSLYGLVLLLEFRLLSWQQRPDHITNSSTQGVE
jgi:hypothetical protein